LDLLRRIVDEYPRTGAARKARAHLGIAEVETEPSDAPAGAASEAATSGRAPTETLEDIVAELEPPAPPPQAEAKPQLPPGFRPKK
jgi:hypothetical protein